MEEVGAIDEEGMSWKDTGCKWERLDICWLELGGIGASKRETRLSKKMLNYTSDVNFDRFNQWNSYIYISVRYMTWYLITIKDPRVTSSQALSWFSPPRLTHESPEVERVTRESPEVLGVTHKSQKVVGVTRKSPGVSEVSHESPEVVGVSHESP